MSDYLEYQRRKNKFHSGGEFSRVEWGKGAATLRFETSFNIPTTLFIHDTPAEVHSGNYTRHTHEINTKEVTVALRWDTAVTAWFMKYLG